MLDVKVIEKPGLEYGIPATAFAVEDIQRRARSVVFRTKPTKTGTRNRRRI